ncbi:hypothetical protein BGZ51_005013 [Haplosporangium sp. Z 767]|nr:hypothetical protein BGZ51_005013 [Haplosporangium sp. Z 767]KAF9192107.1 hypothetical protein BGZ50_008837 [Haplosporangium sp. Z 11]
MNNKGSRYQNPAQPSSHTQMIRDRIAKVQAAIDLDSSQPQTKLLPTLPDEAAKVDPAILKIWELAKDREEYRARLASLIERWREEEADRGWYEPGEMLSEHVAESVQDLVTQTKSLQVTTTNIRTTLTSLTTKVEQIGSVVSSCNRQLQKMDSEQQKKGDEPQKDNDPLKKNSSLQKKDKGPKKMDEDQEKKTMAKLENVLHRINLLKSVLFAGSSEKYFKEPKDLAKDASTMDEDILLVWCRAPSKEAYRAGLCDLYERWRKEKDELKECLGITD